MNSNNQNGIKPRDLRSNDSVQVRLQAEFQKLASEGYSFDVKRGEEGVGTIISNEYAGKLHLAFDLEEPWSCHQNYKVFDEKYTDIFARKEVNAHRIIFLARVMDLIDSHKSKLKNAAFAHYGLTKYMVLAAVKRLLKSDAMGERLCQSPSMAFSGDRLECVLALVEDLLKSIIIDLNHEIEAGQLADYKSDLKNKNSVEKTISDLHRSYEKDKARGKAEVVGDRLRACGVK